MFEKINFQTIKKKCNIYYLIWLMLYWSVWTYFFVRKRWRRVYKRWLRPIKYRETDEEIQRFRETLSKQPKHIAVVVNEEPIEYDKVVQIIRWCQKFNITYVSLFNHKSNFKMSKLEPEVIRSASDEVMIKYRNNENNNYTKISSTSNPKRLLEFEDMKVQIVDYDDSHEAIVRCAKYLCAKPDDFDEDDITAYLRRTFDFPDPDVMTSFGPSPTLYAYPIWQIRLTEIYFLEDHHYFYFDDFCEVLIRYSKCEQRFGK